MSVTFYGTVQDEHGEPISRARIVHACGNTCQYTARVSFSDISGIYIILFDGGSFHVLTCSKQGYETQSETHGARGARKIRCGFKLTKKARQGKTKPQQYISNAVMCGAACTTKDGPCERLTISRPCWQHGGGILEAVVKAIGKRASKPSKAKRGTERVTWEERKSATRSGYASRKGILPRDGLRPLGGHRPESPPSKKKTKKKKPAVIAEPTRSAGTAGGFDTVEFTAIHPSEGAVEKWLNLLVYAHLETAMDDVLEDARRIREKLFPPRIVNPSFGAQIPHGEHITIVPKARGVTFNPNHVTLQWLETYHCAEFRYRAEKWLADDAARGTIAIYVGPLIVGTVKFAMLCGSAEPHSVKINREISRMYRQSEIFFSYSHKDAGVIGEICEYAKTLHEVLIDIDTLRPGDYWSRKLERMIRRAKVFQLFWSSNSCISPAVEQEWRFALELDKPEGFICPVYWEKTMPPIPPELSHIHFQHMKLAHAAQAVMPG